jgi:hypothetical protein
LGASGAGTGDGVTVALQGAFCPQTSAPTAPDNVGITCTTINGELSQAFLTVIPILDANFQNPTTSDRKPDVSVDSFCSPMTFQSNQ